MPGAQRVLLSAAGLPGPLQSHGRALQPAASAPGRLLGISFLLPARRPLAPSRLTPCERCCY